MIRPVSLSLLLAVGASAQPQNSEPARGRLARAIKVIPVPHLVGELARPVGIPFGTMIDCAPGLDGRADSSVITTSDDEARGRITDLPQLIRDLTPLSWDDGHVHVDLIGHALLVTGSPDQIHLVEQSLQQLTATLGEPFRLRATVFSVEAGADLPSVAASFTDLRTQLTQAGASFEWDKTSTAAPAQTVDLGTLTTTSYVCDCDVEIAQSSTMANPITRSLHLGTALLVQAHPLAGSSDIVLLAQYARGESAAPMRELVLGKDDTLPRLQSPTVAVDTGCFSGRIKNGGALVLMADGAWAGRRFGVAVGADRTATSVEAERELGVFPLGAFLSSALRRDFYLVAGDGEYASDLWTPPVMIGEDIAPALEPADSETWNTLFERALGDEQSSVAIGDNLAIVRGPAAAKQTVARLIELMQEQFLKTVEVECRLAGDTDRIGVVAQRLRFPTLLGRRHCVVHGIETTGVFDADVEVAQKSGIADPKVVRHFSGTHCVVQTWSMSASELGTSAGLRLVDTTANKTYVPDNKRGIPLDQPTITRSHHTHEGRVPGDGNIDFGDGPSVAVNDRGVKTRSTLTLRLR